MLDQIHIKPIYAFLILLIVAICSFGLGYGIPRDEYAVRQSTNDIAKLQHESVVRLGDLLKETHKELVECQDQVIKQLKEAK